MSLSMKDNVGQLANFSPPMLCGVGCTATNVFSIDLNGNLLMCQSERPYSARWQNLGIPQGIPLKQGMGIAADSQGILYIFVLDKYENVWCNCFNGSIGFGTWLPCLNTPSVNSSPISLQPIGAAFNGIPMVFAIGGDGNVWVTSPSWDQSWLSSPGPISSSVSINLAVGAIQTSPPVAGVYVLGSDNILYGCSYAATGGESGWQQSTPHPVATITMPIGVTCNSLGELSVFGLDISGNLLCLQCDGSTRGLKSMNLGFPTTGPCTMAVGANINADGMPTVYVTDPQGSMYSNSISLSGVSNGWTALHSPSPTVTVASGIGVASSWNADYAFIFDNNGTVWEFSLANSPSWVSLD